MYKNPKNAFSESYIYDDRKNIPNIYHHQEDSRVLGCWKKNNNFIGYFNIGKEAQYIGIT